MRKKLSFVRWNDAINMKHACFSLSFSLKRPSSLPTLTHSSSQHRVMQHFFIYHRRFVLGQNNCHFHQSSQSQDVDKNSTANLMLHTVNAIHLVVHSHKIIICQNNYYFILFVLISNGMNYQHTHKNVPKVWRSQCSLNIDNVIIVILQSFVISVLL